MAIDWLEAEVLLKKSINKKTENSENQRMEPSINLNEVINIFKTLNIKVIATSPNSISIVGSKDDFHKVFKMKVDNIKSFDTSITVPDVLKEYVEGIYIQSPPTFF